MVDFAQPDERAARTIARDVLGEEVDSCERFATGLRHWVYDVVLESGRNVVVRLSDPRHRDELAGGVFWHGQLRSVGVAVPAVLAHDVDAVQPYMVVERLAGTDLGNVFDDLDDAQLAGIALGVAEMHTKARSLPVSSGFGYALDYGTQLRVSWGSVLEHSIARAGGWIDSVGVVDTIWVDRVRSRLAGSARSFSGVEPRAFLHDATTKNVIVANGEVAGLVDVDEMGFGDPLWAVALTRMSLLAAGRPTRFAELQAQALATGTHVDAGTSDRLDLYTAIHCLSFLGEIGQAFNRTEAPVIDHDHRSHLEDVLVGLLQ